MIVGRSGTVKSAMCTSAPNFIWSNIWVVTMTNENFVRCTINKELLRIALPHVASSVKHCAYADGDRKFEIAASFALLRFLAAGSGIDLGDDFTWPEHWLQSESDYRDLELALERVSQMLESH